MEFTVKEDWEPLMGWSVMLCPCTSNRSSVIAWVPPLRRTRGSAELVTSPPRLSTPVRISSRSSPIVRVLPALRSDPARVILALSSIRTNSSLVVTVLPLSVIRGLVVVLVKVEPSVTRKNLSAMVKVLPESLTRGPARVTVAAPVTVSPALSSTRKKLSPGSWPFVWTVSDPMLKVLFVN